MKDQRTVQPEDEKDFNALCQRYKAAFPNADPPPETIYHLICGFVPTLYSPFFDGLEKAIKTGKPVKNWDRVIVDRPLPQGCVA